MGVDQPGDRVRTQALEGRCDPRFRNGKPGIDKKLAVPAREDGDISARTIQNSDIPTEGMDLDFRLRCRIDHRRDNASLFGKQAVTAQNEGAGKTRRYEIATGMIGQT